MEKEKYALITTISQSMRSFMIPFAEKLKENGFDVNLICNCSSENENEYLQNFKYINIKWKGNLESGQ